MSIHVKKDWWKNYFDDIYLITDARSVCNPFITRKEVNAILKYLPLSKKDKLLDLCGGQGRHSFELAKRGYKDITVLDYSSPLIKLGQASAKKSGVKIRFVKRDARQTGLRNHSYTAVFIMANSFGYFQDNLDNKRVLKETFRILKKKGILLLDLANPEYVYNTIKPVSLHKADKDITVIRHRELADDLLKARELVISKKRGVIRDGCYCTRIYRKNIIKSLLRQVGFTHISFVMNPAGHSSDKDRGLLTSRMFVTAEKP